jgi:hypothetical protein
MNRSLVAAWGFAVAWRPWAVAADSVATVTAMPGLVVFWDFVQSEPDGMHRFVAHVPPGSPTDCPLDAVNNLREFWGIRRAATPAYLGRPGARTKVLQPRKPMSRGWVCRPTARRDC